MAAAAIIRLVGDIEGSSQLPVPNIPTPDCSGLPAGVVADDKSGTVVFSPGRYTSKIEITSKKNNQIFLPGFYCLQGGMQVTNGNLSGTGVTFYIPDDGFRVTGGVDEFHCAEKWGGRF